MWIFFWSKYQLSMTLKVHVAIHHYAFYFSNTGQTFCTTNGEYTETCHSTLRISEETHGLKVVRKIGTPIHQYRSLKSLTMYNSKRAGKNTPIRLRKKSTPSPSGRYSPSPSTYSPFSTLPLSPTTLVTSSPSPFSQSFVERYPMVVQQHMYQINDS